MIRRMSLLFGGVVVGSQLFLEGCTRSASSEVQVLFSPEHIDFLGNIAETILPKTKTPGAKEAGVGAFIPVMVRDCYAPNEQKIFLEGLQKVDATAKEKFGADFQSLTAEQRTVILQEIDNERKKYDGFKDEDMPVHYFTLLRQLTMLGFFSSELGATEALRYITIPGKYNGNLDYKKGDRAWAT